MLLFNLSAHSEIVDSEQGDEKKAGCGCGKAQGQFLTPFHPVELQMELSAFFFQILFHDLVENTQTALLVADQKSRPPVQNIQNRAAVPLIRVFCSKPECTCVSDPAGIDGCERSAGEFPIALLNRIHQFRICHCMSGPVDLCRGFR